MVTDSFTRARKFGLIRALFTNGKQVNWGYAAPTEELRKQANTLVAAHDY